MLTSKVSGKGQITLPAAVRDRMGLRQGDVLTYEWGPGDTVQLRKAAPFDAVWHEALEVTLAEEWNSPEDDAAFASLQELP